MLSTLALLAEADFETASLDCWHKVESTWCSHRGEYGIDHTQFWKLGGACITETTSSLPGRRI